MNQAHIFNKFNLKVDLLDSFWGKFFFYGGVLAYVLINLFLIREGIYAFILFPLALILMWLMIYQPDKVFHFLIFTTPLSIKKEFLEQGVSLSLPNEPIMIVLLGLFFVQLLLNGHFDRKFINHPITMILIISLLWIFITSLTSSIFFVSIKFFIARLWFIVVFFIMGYEFFKKESNIKLFVWLFCLSLTYVIFYSLKRQYDNKWGQLYANFIPQPFFAGHGDYAAAISLFIPFLLVFSLVPKAFKIGKNLRLLAIFILTVFIVGTVLSFARAAWLGLVSALGFYVILRMRIKFSNFIILVCIGLFGFLLTKDAIIATLKDNKKTSADNFTQHVSSISNISTDASNTERINRWMSAFRMFKERPILGWGPNTYVFKYAPFQNSHEMTVISTNAGILGNAHSEYIGPLAEQGIIGSLLMIALVFAFLKTGFQLVYRAKTKFIKYSALACLLALITYFTHGTINNYLDTDKAAVPVFCLLSILVSLEVFHQNKPENQTQL